MTKVDLIVALDMLSSKRIKKFRDRIENDEDFAEKVLSSFSSIGELVIFIETGGKI